MNETNNTADSAFEKPKNKRQVSMRTFVATLLVASVAAFVMGTRSDTLIAKVPAFKSNETPTNLDLSSVQSAYDVLKDKYDGKLDSAAMVEGAKRGMVAATGDPYTTYFSDKEADEFFNDLEGQFSGIGAELGKKENRVFIVTTLDDSPARTSGLAAGDVVVSVNDQDTTDWSIDKAVSEIRGEKGTTVKLNVLRGSEFKEFSIVRDVINNPSVKSEITADNIGVLRISRFGETDTVTLAARAAEEYKAKNVRGIVVDLRGNGGGYLKSAQDLAGLWLEDKVVVTERRNGEVHDSLRTGKNAPLKGIPTVVLVDGGSASASEILAGALKDHKAATLVGEKTFGKGSVQQIESLPGGGQLKVTVAKWYTPNGKNISKEGIKPDHEVKTDIEAINAGQDKQKDKALELLKTQR